MEHKNCLFLPVPSYIQFDNVHHSSIPVELFKVLLLLLDKSTLIQITYVNKNWYAAVQSVLPYRLFEYYNTQIPHPIKEGYLLNSFCEAIEQPKAFFSDYPLLLSGDIDLTNYLFSEAIEKQFLQQFLHRLDIAADGSETLLQFITRSSQAFQQTIDSLHYENSRILCSQYVKTQITHIESQINFIFNRAHIEKFLQLYDRKTYLVKGNLKSDEYYFLAQYLQKAERLESFLITLILFDKFKHHDLQQRQQILINQKWTKMLAGDSLVVLDSCGSLPNLLGTMLGWWDQTGYQENSEHRQKVEFFFIKFQSRDLIAYIKISSYQVENAVFANQPQIVALLCEGSILSDSALVQLLLRTPNIGEFFDKIKNIPELILRLTHPVFLNRFLKITAHQYQEKAPFAIAMLERTFFLSKLKLEDAFDLAKIALPHSHSGKSLELFEYSALAKQFTSEQISILLDLPKVLPCVRHAHEYILRKLFRQSKMREEQAELIILPNKKCQALSWNGEEAGASTPEVETELTRHIIQTQRMANTIRRQQAEQETRTVQFFKKMLSWYGISTLWLLISLALIITGGVLGGLGIITGPVMTTLLTVGGLLLISLMIVSAIIKIYHTLANKNNYLDSSDSSDDEYVSSWSFQAHNMQQSPRPMSDMPQQQNSAAYAQVLQPGASAPLTENEPNHYPEDGLPKSPAPVQSQISSSISTTSPDQQNPEIYQTVTFT